MLRPGSRIGGAVRLHAPRYTPNPIAAGIPTDGLPVLLDISASTTTNGMVGRLQRANAAAHAAEDRQMLGGPWLVDNRGEASNDPAAVFSEPPGAILPLGGMDLGHKGFALGLLVEALTSGLGGYGRADGETRWGASVFIQIIDPAHFGGIDRFRRETGWLAQACRTAPVQPGQPAVRLPGQRGLLLKEEQLRRGLALHPDTAASLAALAQQHGMAIPEPV